MQRLLSALLVCGLLSLIAGCRDGLTRSPLTSDAGVVAAYDYVPTYSKAPCWMQRKWTAHNSVHASNEKGERVVYKAPCDVMGGDEKKSSNPSSTSPKAATS